MKVGREQEAEGAGGGGVGERQKILMGRADRAVWSKRRYGG